MRRTVGRVLRGARVKCTLQRRMADLTAQWRPEDAPVAPLQTFPDQQIQAFQESDQSNAALRSDEGGSAGMEAVPAWQSASLFGPTLPERSRRSGCRIVGEAA